ncbi:MAG: YchF-related putative GTPase [Candidatus Nanohaloarchaea archaeon]|nr:YchF-related putative GTPase [Candidatus Nanohaloarchaea archaeon]
MRLGIVGKPNVGKSTFFQCITDSDAEVGDYPFTTVDPNHGVGYVVVDCACQRLQVECDVDRCVDGRRKVPVNVADVAGLVPGAAEGRGMGNEFLDDMRAADALIHVLDVSGRTDAAGEPAEDYDVAEDVEFIADELDAWLAGLLQQRWDRLTKALQEPDTRPDAVIADHLSGLGITQNDVATVLEADTSALQRWTGDDIEEFVQRLRRQAMPMLHACNKTDMPGAAGNLDRLEQAFPAATFVPVSAQAEQELQAAAEQGKIDYVPGDSDFDIVGDVSEEQEDGLEQIRGLLQEYGGTGVQQVMREAVFDLLDMIVVYPVEDASNYTDQHGNVLPDAVLVPEGATPVDLAYEIHSDIGDDYAAAVDAETGRAIGKETALEEGQVVKIETQ